VHGSLSTDEPGEAVSASAALYLLGTLVHQALPHSSGVVV